MWHTTDVRRIARGPACAMIASRDDLAPPLLHARGDTRRDARLRRGRSVAVPPRRRRVLAAAVIVASLLLWVGLRDLNPPWLVVATVSAALLAFVARAERRVRRTLAAAAAAAVALALVAGFGAHAGMRWRYPLV